MVKKNNRDYELEKVLNDTVREEMATKLLADLSIDLTVCELMTDNPLCDDNPLIEWKKYLEKIKKEIDNLYERISDRKT